jgi:hypothetical protein
VRVSESDLLAEAEGTPGPTQGKLATVREAEFVICDQSIENRIKELKEGVHADRTSCHAFEGNQFRLMLSCVAYVLFSALRRLARKTGLERAQVQTLRLAVIQIGARVKESLRRVKIELCSSCPSQEVWRLLARRLGIVLG